MVKMNVKRRNDFMKTGMLMFALMGSSFISANATNISHRLQTSNSFSASDSLVVYEDSLQGRTDSLITLQSRYSRFLEKNVNYRLGYKYSTLPDNTEGKLDVRISSDADSLIINKVLANVGVTNSNTLSAFNDSIDFRVPESGVYDFNFYFDDKPAGDIIKDVSVSEVALPEIVEPIKEPVVPTISSSKPKKKSKIPAKKSVEIAKQPVDIKVKPAEQIRKSTEPAFKANIPIARETQIDHPRGIIRDSVNTIQESQNNASVGTSEVNDTTTKSVEKSTVVDKDSVLATSPQCAPDSEEKKDSLWNINPWMVCSVFMAVILALLAYYLARQLRKYSDLKVTITSQNSRLYDLNLKSQELARQQVIVQSKESETKNMSNGSNASLVHVHEQQVYILNNYAHELVKACDFINTSLDKLQQVIDNTQRNFKHRSTVLNLKKELESYRESLLEKDFIECYNQTYPQLETALKKQFNSLTSGDLRLCRYLSLGLSTADIATLCDREIRTIDSSRNRLRKKLNLSPGEDFSALFNTLLN